MKRLISICALLVLLWPAISWGREIKCLGIWSYCMSKLGEDVCAHDGYEFVSVMCFDEDGKAYLINHQPKQFQIPQEVKLVRIKIRIINVERDLLQEVSFEMGPP